MSGETRVLEFSEGISVGSPVTTNVTALGVTQFASDPDFVSGKGEPAAEGDLYYNTTLDTLRMFKDVAWVNTQDQASPVITSDTTQATNTTTGALIVPGGAGIAKDVFVGGSLTVTQDLNVLGDNTILETQTVESEDNNILLNKGGNDASSEGGGFEVERTSTNGSFKFQDSLATKFALGLLGAEAEIADISTAQSLTNKSLVLATANRATETNGSGVVIPSAVTSTELGYVSGVTSAIQTQIDSKRSGDFALTSKSANYTLLSTDEIVTSDATGGTFTLTLPTAVGITGKSYKINRIDNNLGNAVIVDANGSETINGVLTLQLRTQWESLNIISDGTNWLAIEHKTNMTLTAYTPSFQGFGTVSSIQFMWGRLGDLMIILGKFTSGTSTAVEAQMTLPTGATIDSTKVASIRNVGNATRDRAVADPDWHILATANDAFLNIGRTTTSLAGLTPSNGDALLASGDAFSFVAHVPITNWSAL